MSRFEVINPTSLGRPRGYNNGLLGPAGGRTLFVAGQIAWNEAQEIVSDEFAAQFERALANVLAVVTEAGGSPAHLGRLTLYVVDRREYLAALEGVGAAYRRLMGDHYPAMALVEVAALLEPGAKVEIEGTAVLPAES